MKYIITESKLNKFMKNYLDNYKENRDVHYMDSYIIIPKLGDNDFATAELEYDSWDGRLFIDRSFLETFISWLKNTLSLSLQNGLKKNLMLK